MYHKDQPEGSWFTLELILPLTNFLTSLPMLWYIQKQYWKDIQ